MPAKLDNPLQQIMQISQLLRDQRATDELRLTPTLSGYALPLARVWLCSAPAPTPARPGLAWAGLVWLGLSSAFVGGQCDTRRREKQQFTCHRLT